MLVANDRQALLDSAPALIASAEDELFVIGNFCHWNGPERNWHWSNFWWSDTFRLAQSAIRLSPDEPNCDAC